MLAYEFMPNGTLREHISGTFSKISLNLHLSILTFVVCFPMASPGFMSKLELLYTY